MTECVTTANISQPMEKPQKFIIPRVQQSETAPPQISFGKLIMHPLAAYEISDDIRYFDEKGSAINRFKNLISVMRQDETKYVEAITKLLFMEEVAENERLETLKLLQVKFNRKSDQVFHTKFDVNIFKIYFKLLLLL